MRMAVAAAEGLSLPDQRSLAGIHSSEALAWGILQERPAVRVAVGGDARRQRFWMAAYQMREGLPEPCIPLSLADETGLREALAGADVVATLHGGRIGSLLAGLRPSGAELVVDHQLLARDVVRLALRGVQRGLSLMPCRPVYLHPPVSRDREKRGGIEGRGDWGKKKSAAPDGAIVLLSCMVAADDGSLRIYADWLPVA